MEFHEWHAGYTEDTLHNSDSFMGHKELDEGSTVQPPNEGPKVHIPGKQCGCWANYGDRGSVAMAMFCCCVFVSH